LTRGHLISVRASTSTIGPSTASTRSSAAFTAEIDAGVQLENIRFSFEVRGSDGWLSLTSKHPYGFQAGDLKLTSNVLFVEPDVAAVAGGTTETAINVGEIYAQLVRDLHEGTYKTPGFQHALHNARLTEAVRRAAERGERQRPLEQGRPRFRRSLANDR
jgi:predicted dehydrogenase